MSVAIDLAQGITTVYAAAGALTAVMPAARFYFGTNPGSPAFPYGTLAITKWKDSEFTAPATTNASHVSYQTATFTVYALQPTDVELVIDLIRSAFRVEFTVSNSTMLEWWYDDDSSTEIPEKKDGDPLHEGRIVFNTALQRTMP